LGIYDRDYYRQEDAKVARQLAKATPAVYILLAVSGLILFLEVFGNARNERSPFYLACSFSAAKFQSGEVWRALTYPIVSLHPMDYLYALCTLLIFGRPYERRFGSAWFLGTYFGSAAIAALGVWGFTSIGMLGGATGRDVFDGPSSALLGLLGAVFFTLGRSETTLHLPSPMTFEMRWVAVVTAAIGLLTIADSYWQPHMRFIALFGMFAGMIIGKIAGMLGERRDARADKPRWSSRRRDDEPVTVKFPVQKAKAAAADNVDDLLKKISAEGIDSLTDAEKERLNAASASRRQQKG
jgi:membrane associated rhomboid family serine protease